MTRHAATPEQVTRVLRESHPRDRVRQALGDSSELAALLAEPPPPENVNPTPDNRK